MIKTRQKLARQYGVSPHTFRRWLKKHNIHLSKEHLKPKELELIYATFGRPYQATLSENNNSKTELILQKVK